MSEEKKKELLGWVCVILGSIFVVAGIVLFLMSNKMNLQMRKVTATVLASYDLTDETGLKHTMLELMYDVGGQNVFTTYEYPGVLDEYEIAIDVYYNIKEPGMVMNIKWSWEPLLVSLMGVLLLIPGLYLKGFIKNSVFEISAPAENCDNITKELYKAKKTVIDNALPMLAGVLFITFGIVMLAMRGEWWSWMFICVGAVEALYIGMDFVPAVITWMKLGKLESVKAKAKAYNVDVTDEKTEDK